MRAGFPILAGAVRDRRNIIVCHIVVVGIEQQYRAQSGEGVHYNTIRGYLERFCAVLLSSLCYQF